MIPAGLIYMGTPGGGVSTGSNLDNAILSLAPTRYYKLFNAVAGNQEQDYGSDGKNGSWSGGVSQVKSLTPGDTLNSALFDGVSGRLSMPTAGLPSGSNSFTIGFIVTLLKIQAGLQFAFQIGTNAGSLQNLDFDWGNTAVEISWTAATSSVNFSSGLSSPLGTPVLYVVTYDGATIRFWVNNFNISGSAAVLNMTYGNANLGANSAASPGNFGNMIMQRWFCMKGTALNQTQITNIVQAWQGS